MVYIMQSSCIIIPRSKSAEDHMQYISSSIPAAHYQKHIWHIRNVNQSFELKVSSKMPVKIMSYLKGSCALMGKNHGPLVGDIARCCSQARTKTQDGISGPRNNVLLFFRVSFHFLIWSCYLQRYRDVYIHIMQLSCVIISRSRSAEDHMQYHNVRTFEILYDLSTKM